MALWILVSVFSFLCFVPLRAGAQVMMTEVMYDLEGTDTGREWIEVYNTGSSGVDLADWKLYEANTNHRLTAQSASVVPAQGFAIIADNTAKFLTDNPNFSGVLFDSVFSLSNEGETLVLRDGAGTDIDTVSYTSALGAVGDGMSLQKSGSNWIATLPTIGAIVSSGTSQASESTTQTSSSSPSTTSGGSSSSHSSQSVASGLADEVSLEVSSGRDRLGFVGTPLSFEARVKQPKNLSAVSVAHGWSMGDGSKKNGQFISHSYVYPGDYVVILNSEYGGDKAVSKIKVRIVSPKVSVRDANQDFIELGNDSVDELNLGGWVLETNGGRFVIPQDTIILPRGSIRLPYLTTRLRPTGFVHLVNQSLTVVASRDVSTNFPIVINDAGEPVIALGGLTEDVIRRQFAVAIQSTRQGNDVLPTASLVREVSVPTNAVAQIPTSTQPTQAAAVIYTVGQNSKTRGFFGKFFDFFSK